LHAGASGGRSFTVQKARSFFPYLKELLTLKRLLKKIPRKKRSRDSWAGAEKCLERGRNHLNKQKVNLRERNKRQQEVPKSGGCCEKLARKKGALLRMAGGGDLGKAKKQGHHERSEARAKGKDGF